jgi:WD40 repeat protein
VPGRVGRVRWIFVLPLWLCAFVSVTPWGAAHGARAAATRVEPYVGVGHATPVTALAWSPDGRTLATASFHDAILWDAANGAPDATLTGHVQVIQTLAWSPDGKTLATGSLDTVILWDAPTGTRRAVLQGAGIPIAWSPSGGTLATNTNAYDGSSVILWEPSAARRRAELKSGDGWVRHLAWSPDGKTLAVSHWDADQLERGRVTVFPFHGPIFVRGDPINLWDAATGRRRATLSGQGDSIVGPAWSPDGKILASASFDRDVILWNPATGQRRALLSGHKQAIVRLAWSPDGRQLASMESDKHLTTIVWDPIRGKRRATLADPAEVLLVGDLAWSADGKTLAVGRDNSDQGNDSLMILWDPLRARRRAILMGTSAPLAWSPVANFLATGALGHAAVIWDAEHRTVRTRFVNHAGIVQHLTWSPDGKTLATDVLWRELGQLSRRPGRGPAAVQIPEHGWPGPSTLFWDLRRGRLQFPRDGDRRPVVSPIWSPDGKILATWSAYGLGDIQQPLPALILWDTEAWKRRATIGRVWGDPKWSPDSTTLAAGMALWDASGSYHAFLPHAWRLTAWSPDGKTLATDSSGSAILLWEAATGRLHAILNGHTDRVTLLAWSPDGKTLASGSLDKTVILWEAATGRLRLRLTGYAGPTVNLTWSPGGDVLATQALVPAKDPLLHQEVGEGKVTLCDARTGEPRAVLVLGDSSISTLAWSPDGRTLATIAWKERPRVFYEADTAVYLWDPAAGKARARLTPPAGAIWKMAWSPDGKTLATAAWDQTVILWNAAAGNPRAILPSPAGAVQDFAWSPNGRFIALASDEGSVSLWSPGTGQQIVTLYGLDRGREWLAVTPEGYFTASPAGVKVLQWRQGAKLWPVDKFRHRFERPDLVRRALAGERVQPRAPSSTTPGSAPRR